MPRKKWPMRAPSAEPAGDRARALPAERGPQLAEHELVEQGVLQAQDDAGAARVEGLAVGDGRRLGHVEDPALAVVVRLDLGAVVDLLEHARHREQEVGLEAGQLGGQLLRVGEVADRVAVLHRGALDDAGEDVREREEQQRRVPGRHEVRERVGDGAHLEQQVAVGDLAALGAARGARGVDQRREVVGVHRRPALLQRRVVDARAGVAQGAHRAVGAVDLPHVLELGELLAQVLDDGAVLVGLDDHALGAGVGQAPLDLVGRRGLVDREGHRAGRPEGVVEQRPLVARRRDEADPVAGLQARGEEALRGGGDLVAEGRERHVLPLVVDQAAVGDVAAVRVGVGPRRGGEVVVVGHLGGRRLRVLLHLAPLLPRAPRCVGCDHSRGGLPPGSRTIRPSPP